MNECIKLKSFNSVATLLIFLALSGCNTAEDEHSLAAKNAALVVTCAPNLPIYEWSGKLYYREAETFRFRRVISKVEDVCDKFKATDIATNGKVVSQ